MPLTHLLLILASVLVWGTNFVAIKWGLAELPPLLLASLRFLFSALPFVFFLKRPAVPWRHLVAVGLLLGVGQFGLLFQAMRADVSAGWARRRWSSPGWRSMSWPRGRLHPCADLMRRAQLLAIAARQGCRGAC